MEVFGGSFWTLITSPIWGPTPTIYGLPPKIDPFYNKFGPRSHDMFGAVHKICNPRSCFPTGVLWHDSHCFLRFFSTFCAANFHGNMACPGTVNRCGLKHMKVDHDCRDFPQKSPEKCNTGDASLIQLFDLSKPSMVVHLKDLHVILLGPWCQYSYLVSNVMARWCSFRREAPSVLPPRQGINHRDKKKRKRRIGKKKASTSHERLCHLVPPC